MLPHCELQAEEMAKKLNAGGCMQSSAKTQEGLKAVFDRAVNVILHHTSDA